MGAPETWLIRGEGGDIIPMDLPLGEGIAARLRSGALVRINPDGTPWTSEQPAGDPTSFAEQRAAAELAEQEAERERRGGELPRPDQNDRKADWVAYAASTGRITADAAADLTKSELIARFGG